MHDREREGERERGREREGEREGEREKAATFSLPHCRALPSIRIGPIHIHTTENETAMPIISVWGSR
jgi:hypothetical protein